MTQRSQTIDLTEPSERAFLIGVDPTRGAHWPIDRSLDELDALARTAGAQVVGSTYQRRERPDPDWYLGKGRAQELVVEKEQTGFNVLIADDELTPAQQRRLEELLNCKVLDRSGLIIDIFARHARTREGRLQVELAQMEYHLPRLTRLWRHLSRTGGGIGTRGPGESQLETDRRLIRERIKKLRAEIDEVKRQRATAARKRERTEIATVALVGYTNAGKSTLLNTLARADVYAADVLFATLDPTSRQVALPSGQQVVVTDTVGFIHKLPHDLVDAFRATLEEVVRADLLVEVVDASDRDFVAQQRAVADVLAELGADRKPRITAFNKIDRIDPDLRSELPHTSRAVFISAVTGTGIPELLDAVQTALRDQMVDVDSLLPYDRGDLVARARTSGDVEERYAASGVRLRGRLPAGLASEIAAVGGRNGRGNGRRRGGGVAAT